MRVSITTTIDADLCEQISIGNKKQTRIKELPDLEISKILAFGIKFLIAERKASKGDIGEYPTNSQTEKLARAMERLNGINES